MFRDPFFHEPMRIIVITCDYVPELQSKIDHQLQRWRFFRRNLENKGPETLPLSPLYSPCKPTETGLVDLSLIQVAHGLLGRGHQYRPGDTEV